MNQKLNALLLGFAVASLAACGGGGEGDGVKKDLVLSPTQQNFEASAIKDSWVRLNWNMPTTSAAPTNGVNYFFQENFSLPFSPAKGAVDLSTTQANMSSTLGLPDLTKLGVVRAVKSGAIFMRNYVTRNSYSYIGNDVVENLYASDGATLLNQVQYSSWSEPVPLMGTIANAAILKRFFSFTKSTSTLYDFTKSWQSGASYVTRKSFYPIDMLDAWDWTGTPNTYTTAVTPYPGIESKIEGLFLVDASVVSAGGVVLDGITYPFSSGTIKTIEGVRTWVANTKRPTSVSPTDQYLAIFELNGQLYRGGVIWANTPIHFIDGVDTTIVNDYNIRLNAAAAASIKQSLNF